MAAALEHAPDALLQPAVAYQGKRLATRRFGAGFVQGLDRVRQESRSPLADIRDRQLSAIQIVVRNAWCESTFYRDVMTASSLTPEDVVSLAAFEQFPLLAKQDVIGAIDTMLTRSPSSHDVLHHTSGSTGRRMEFWLPDALRFTGNASHLYGFYDWFGFERGMKRVTLGGRYLGRRKRGRVLLNASENQMALSSHSLSADSIDRYVTAIRRFSPQAIQGHPSVIGQFVELAQEKRASIPVVPLVFTTGEELSQELRMRIREGFSAEHVVNMYGSGENVVMASECPCGHGLHVDESFGYVELIAHASGMMEIVATSLLNDLMPFIRYRTGDLTRGWIEGECECGRTWRRLDGVVGRIDDAVRAADGSRVLPLEFRTLVAARVPDAPVYTVRVAEDGGWAELVLYDDESTPRHTIQAMEGVVRELLGDAIPVTVLHKQAQEALSFGGKHRIVETVRPVQKEDA